MIVKTMWGKRKSEPENLPELMVAWDEYTIDLNPDGFAEDCERARVSWGSDLEEYRYVDISLSEEDIDNMFATTNILGLVKK